MPKARRFIKKKAEDIAIGDVICTDYFLPKMHWRVYNKDYKYFVLVSMPKDARMFVMSKQILAYVNKFEVLLEDLSTELVQLSPKTELFILNPEYLKEKETQRKWKIERKERCQKLTDGSL